MTRSSTFTTPPAALLFDVQDDWNAPRFRWHDSYPENAPPGVICPRMRVEEFLDRSTKRFPDRHAIHFYSTSWTYEELSKRVAKVAGSLQEIGISPGDRVLLVLPNCPEFIVLWFALHRIGAEIVHGNPLYPAEDIASLIKRTGAKMVVGLDVRMEPIVDALPDAPVPFVLVTSLASHLSVNLRTLYHLKTWLSGRVRVPSGTKLLAFKDLYRRSAAPVTESKITDDEQVAVLQPTGGTTGTPKLAMITHRNLVVQICQNNVMVRREMGTDTVVAVLPFFHVYGSTVILLASMSSGTTMLLFPRFDARQIAAAMERHGVTALPLVPFMFHELNRELTIRPRKLTKLDIVTSGAAPLDPDVRKKFQELTNTEITEGYGLSEASPVLTANIKETNRPGTVGVPISGTEIKIVDPADGITELPPGDVGELIARGPQIMKGYLDNPKETANTIRNGWLYTGDLAVMEQDGFIRIVDRKKDMIITGGLNVYPSEVEPKILACTGVAQCAVVGQKDQLYGEKVVAYIVAKPGVTLDTAKLKEECKAHLAGYKVPRQFIITDELPVSFLGKVRRVELRADKPEPTANPPGPSAN